MAVSLGHSLEPPVPSLFTFEIDAPWLPELAGVSVQPAEASIPGTGLREIGPVLITHRGLSGPGILRLSAWGARALHHLNYHFTVEINWLPETSVAQIETEIQARRDNQPSRFVINTPMRPVPARLWERLVALSGLPPETRWAALSRSAQHNLIQRLIRTQLLVTGKSLNKDEFVTCGGVPLNEVNFKTMESRICPRLFFAGELLDIDGITGGFNFQAAWTTGWIAGQAIAAHSSDRWWH
jgi:predicted Rossmann fold flavoprotein